MWTIQRFISAGFACAALASASLPALSWSVWPNVDFEWYANVGRAAAPTVEVFPAPRAGYIWAPGQWETRDGRREWIAGRWIVDDYEQQRIAYNSPAQFATGSMELRDRDGNVIATSPEAYPIDSNRR